MIGHSKISSSNSFVSPITCSFRCELFAQGGAFWVQLFRGRDLLIGRRFETKALAVKWAEFLRRAVEKGEIV